MGKAYGYIRQTPKDQNDVTQLTMLVDAGVNEAFLFEDWGQNLKHFLGLSSFQTPDQKAYEALLNVLEMEHRGCVIHPTGTGKSFIGFQYCEDHPRQAVLWLSPSEYIFKTQCESLRAAGGELPGNITFMTYAKLSMLEPEELNSLHPDVVILDEMHRAAAPTWEKPVQKTIL